MSYTNYLEYETLGEWFDKDGRYSFPTAAPRAVQGIMKRENLSFHDAFEYALKNEVIIVTHSGAGVVDLGKI